MKYKNKKRKVERVFWFEYERKTFQNKKRKDG